MSSDEDSYSYLRQCYITGCQMQTRPGGMEQHIRWHISNSQSIPTLEQEYRNGLFNCHSCRDLLDSNYVFRSCLHRCCRKCHECSSRRCPFCRQDSVIIQRDLYFEHQLERFRNYQRRQMLKRELLAKQAVQQQQQLQLKQQQQEFLEFEQQQQLSKQSSKSSSSFPIKSRPLSVTEHSAKHFTVPSSDNLRRRSSQKSFQQQQQQQQRQILRSPTPKQSRPALVHYIRGGPPKQLLFTKTEPNTEPISLPNETPTHGQFIVDDDPSPASLQSSSQQSLSEPTSRTENYDC